MLGGGIAWLTQVKADENGELYYELPEGCPADGDIINIYGACSHPSAHFEDSGYGGQPIYICDICGQTVPPVIDMSRLPDPYLLGDADGDGAITSIDVTLVQRYCANIYTGIDEGVLMNADVDENGLLEITDATFIQRWLANLATPCPVGETR